MKVIDLLNKIANGEEVSEYVKYYNMLKEKVDIMMVCKENLFYKLDQLEIQLNSRVEIIEEPQEHKIPEKLTIGVNEYDEIHINNEIYGERQVRVVADKVNEILDYLEVNDGIMD